MISVGKTWKTQEYLGGAYVIGLICLTSLKETQLNQPAVPLSLPLLIAFLA